MKESRVWRKGKYERQGVYCTSCMAGQPSGGLRGTTSSTRATRDSSTGRVRQGMRWLGAKSLLAGVGNRELGFDLGERGKKGDQGAYELGKMQDAVSSLSLRPRLFLM